MPTPDRTTIRRRLALGAAVLAAVVVLAMMIATGGGEREATPAPAVPPAKTIDVRPQPLPLPAPPLSRGELIALAARAASAYAAGQPPPEANAALVGRRFRIRIPFGCQGPGEQPGSAASWTQSGRAIRLTARPQDWTQANWVRTLAGDGPYDAIEGFWLPRPWTTVESCPLAAPEGADADAAEPEQTLALAMFFEKGSSRVLQRGGRPYEHVLNAPDSGQPIAPTGFRLVLEGRVSGFEDGQPARCRGDGPNVRPTCLIAVEFEQVAFEDPAGGQTLAEWRTN